MSEGVLEDVAPTAAGIRTVAAGVVGNVLEWYDFALYGFFAPTIGRLFFPSESRVASLLATYGVFALAFALRPLGGLIFGHIGDRMGRKKALELSVLLMAVPTTLLGLLPTYHDIGLAAPIALTAIRALQGISVGGEFIGSISFLGEHAPSNRRGLLGSWTSASATLGAVLGSLVAALGNAAFLPHEVRAGDCTVLQRNRRRFGGPLAPQGHQRDPRLRQGIARGHAHPLAGTRGGAA